MLGETISHYRILEKLGQGGMGEVYRARDTKLGREVAFKILPRELSSDLERTARFEREARTLASLQHPNIASIYGFDEAEGIHFLTMELVEGEDLTELIRRGRVPLAKALHIARQITLGLEAAHQKGIVHRDLKPANVKVGADGVVKLLDFGLARHMELAAHESIESQTPTVTARLTVKGLILGTAGYMSPEQARGEPVDHRTDIWAFGCVLFEMLVGARAFPGKTATDTIARILERDPDFERLPRALPPSMRRLLRRCLEKQTQNRLQAIGDARISIQEYLDDPATADGGMAAGQRWHMLPWLAIPLVAAFVWLLKPATVPLPTSMMRYEITVPDGKRLAPHFRRGIALSPDGQNLAFVAGVVNNLLARGDSVDIYIRRLDQWTTKRIPDTSGAEELAFSFDGDWLAFGRGRGITKVPMAGGESVPICNDCGPTFGLTWGENGKLTFARQLGGLLQLPATGGEPDAVTHLDLGANEASHRLPRALPGGEDILFTVVLRGAEMIDDANTQIWVYSSKSNERKLLIEGGSDAQYTPSGHLVFMRNGQLLAAPFDLDRLDVTGDEVSVVRDVIHAVRTKHSSRETAAGQFAVSSTGVLAYAKGPVLPELPNHVFRVDRTGREEEVDLRRRPYLTVRVSADGRKLLLSALSPKTVWVHDLVRETERRQTFDEKHLFAIWGPGTDSITMESHGEEGRSVSIKQVDSGPGAAKQLGSFELKLAIPCSWSTDTNLLAMVASGTGLRDIWVVETEGKVSPYLDSSFDEIFPDFSPDGQWLAYVSSESGQYEVYVRPYPGPGRSIQISNGGGASPAWSRDGKQLIYTWGGRFHSVKMSSDDGQISPGRPVVLFENDYISTMPTRSFDVAPDGSIFAIKGPSEDVVAAALAEYYPDRIHVVQNWFAQLSEMAPASR